MRIVELVIDEEAEVYGIEAISLVESPAIQSDFVALKEQQITFTTQDEDKRLVMGAALIPDKPIYRKNGDDEFYVYFSKKTVRRAMELYFKNGYQANATLEHEAKINGLHLVESWIVEGEQDKSRMYGLDAPIGSWVVTMKVENDAIWEQYVKDGKVKGFSIEGFFTDKFDLSKTELEEPCWPGYEMIGWKTKDGKRVPNCVPIQAEEEVEMESYTDYPKSATNAARRAIEYKEKNGSDCGTRVGWTRARQLADRKPISRDVISRMASFARHQQNKDVPYTEGCGGLMWDAWGGTAGIEWAQNKLDEIEKMEAVLTAIEKELGIDELKRRLSKD